MSETNTLSSPTTSTPTLSNSAGRFFWYELMTSDTTAAEDFYRAVVGWGARDSGMFAETPDFAYTLFTVGATGIAGMMKMPEACEQAGPPSWMGYICVDDTDAYVERVKAAGGKVMRDPDDIPNVGRFMVAADPHGAVFVLMTPTGETPADYPAPDATGMIGWRELHAGNGDEAFTFYSELFGWQKTSSLDMGSFGVYQMFGVDGEAKSGEGEGEATGCVDHGAVMSKMPDSPVPFWLFYFNVPSISEAIERIKANNGQIVMGPHEVPGGSWIVQGFDPQGALFALVAPKF